jgi:SNF2 family DNA or RNA helicase
MNDYLSYIENKKNLKNDFGFKPTFLPDFLFDFQKYIIEWAVKKGRCGIFSDCGTGKTIMQLVWAQNVIKKTNKPVLLLTPLSVTIQTENEADKFGIFAKKSIGKVYDITIVNYQKLHYFDPSKFSGIICDESSILKNFDGKIKNQITQFVKKIPYRSLWTATAAPNDYIELGTSSEALGYLGYVDMLNKFFKNDQNNSSLGRIYGKLVKWRFKGHAEIPFWKWVSTWALSMRKPSDLNFDDGNFILPDLIETIHVIKNNIPVNNGFFNYVTGISQEREMRKITIKQRCEKVAELANKIKAPVLIWCNLNEEGDLLEKIILDGLQVAGKHRDEIKEERLIGFANNDFRVLITKPKIGAWGLNYQHCSNIINFPTHSYEQYYQGIRRCWRFGQKNKVIVDNIIPECDRYIFKNLERKKKAAEVMFERLLQYMNDINFKEKTELNNKIKLPKWIIN